MLCHQALSFCQHIALETVRQETSVNNEAQLQRDRQPARAHQRAHLCLCFALLVGVIAAEGFSVST